MRVVESFGLRSVGEKEVGIEIEMEGRGVAGAGGVAIPTSWIVVADGSLRGESAEWVLRQPVLRKDVPKVLKAASDYLKEIGATINDSDRCGVHIHVNVQQLTNIQVLNFILLYLIFEDLLVKYCGEEREGNLFCLRARDAEVLLIQLRECKVSDSLMPLQNDAYRYASVNVSAIGKYGSLEFRALKTPKRVTDIEPWANMLLSLKDYSLKIEDSRDIVEAFSKNGELGFLHTVFNSELSKLLLCKDAATLMREGVRRIQEIAYAKILPKKKEPAAFKSGWNPALVVEPRINQLAQAINERQQVELDRIDMAANRMWGGRDDPRPARNLPEPGAAPRRRRPIQAPPPAPEVVAMDPRWAADFAPEDMFEDVPILDAEDDGGPI